MGNGIAESIFEKVKTLPSFEQRKVLDAVEKRLAIIEERKKRPIWEVITEISSEIPEEEWAKLPSDGSVNHDHYLYGAPKKY